jgi:hypothetical protein
VIYRLLQEQEIIGRIILEPKLFSAIIKVVARPARSPIAAAYCTLIRVSLLKNGHFKEERA